VHLWVQDRADVGVGWFGEALGGGGEERILWGIGGFEAYCSRE